MKRGSVGLWLCLASCAPQVLDPDDPADRATLDALIALDTRCADGDLAESDLEGFPAFFDPVQALRGRVGVAIGAGVRRTDRITATFRNDVSLTIDAPRDVRVFGRSLRRAEQVTVLWTDASGDVRSACGGATATLETLSGTNSPFRLVMPVEGLGPACDPPERPAELRFCF